MNQKIFNQTAAVIFAIVAILHGIRGFVFRWDITIADFSLPLWVSWVATIFIGTMAYSAWKLRS